jgi:hypothetical protein
MSGPECIEAHAGAAPAHLFEAHEYGHDSLFAEAAIAAA